MAWSDAARRAAAEARKRFSTWGKLKSKAENAKWRADMQWSRVTKINSSGVRYKKERQKFKQVQKKSTAASKALRAFNLANPRARFEYK